MGAVCYKPKPSTISREDILKALNDKHLKESITEPDAQKTIKTDEQCTNLMLTFGTLTQQLNLDTHGPTSHPSTPSRKNQKPPSPQTRDLGHLELNILSYYGFKDDIYSTLSHLSKKSLYFMKKNYPKIENMSVLKHANEKIRFVQVKTIEEHSSGVNQLLKINSKELVTASDDCYIKFWSSQNMKVEASIATETITCIALTGGSNSKQKDILVAGCHSGNLVLVNAIQKVKKELINSAHYNLIRVIVTLEALKNKYFVTADVCGIVKVWTSQFKAQQVMEIEQEGAISYNSLIEVQDILPKRSTYEDTAVIACALKSQKINLILLIPGSGTYQLIKTLTTSLKPTCLIQLSNKHLAIAVGSLKEDSHVEIHNVNKNKVVSVLRMHKDMIDSMMKVEFSEEKIKSKNKYVMWFLTASRDRQIVLWKLIDGKIMRRNEQNLQNSTKKIIKPPVKNGVRTFDQVKSKQKPDISKKRQKDRVKKRRKNSQGEEEEEDEEYIDEESDQEEEKSQDVLKQSEEEKQNDSEQLKGSSLDVAKQTPSDKLIDYYYAFDTGHKDFIRSMVQINNGNTLVTASEDKTIKMFNIVF